MNVYPVFVCCKCAKLTLNFITHPCEDDSPCCFHTTGFSEHEHMIPREYLLVADKKAKHFRDLHKKMEAELK
jgi:hypothetical protein